MTSYASGVKFEYFVKKYLERLGYVVIRSAGSHGAIDLFSFYYDDSLPYCVLSDVVLIQCKKENKKKSYVKDEEQLKKLRVPVSWKKELWIKRKGKIVVRNVDTGDEEEFLLSHFSGGKNVD